MKCQNIHGALFSTIAPQQCQKYRDRKSFIPANILSQPQKIPVSFCVNFACSLVGKQSKTRKDWSRLGATLSHLSPLRWKRLNIHPVNKHCVNANAPREHRCRILCSTSTSREWYQQTRFSGENGSNMRFNYFLKRTSIFRVSALCAFEFVSTTSLSVLSEYVMSYNDLGRLLFHSLVTALHV